PARPSARDRCTSGNRTKRSRRAHAGTGARRSAHATLCAHARAPLVPHLGPTRRRDDVAIAAVALRTTGHDEVRAAHASHLDAMARLRAFGPLPEQQVATRI